MQTFLPVPDFYETARILDYRRLGKQRLETLQILNALLGRSKGWVNHPATRMWRGYEGSLVHYGTVMCDEWVSKGYKDTTKAKILELGIEPSILEVPPWLGREDFHASHRSNLLRKDPEFYSVYGWSEPDNLEYVWPL